MHKLLSVPERTMVLALSALCLLSACTESTADATDNQERPLNRVVVVEVENRDLELERSFAARTEGSQVTEVRARVGGELESREFTEGQVIEAGDPMFPAQFERWTLPLTILTAIPFAVFGAAALTWATGLQNNIYFQVGLLVLIGLAVKNAILIVQFAVLNRKQGLGILSATLTACQQRFRPILMTSLAFIFGALPLAFSSGAGAAARQAVGVTVVGGMLLATFVSIFFIPVFYHWLEKSLLRLKLRRRAAITQGR